MIGQTAGVLGDVRPFALGLAVLATVVAAGLLAALLRAPRREQPAAPGPVPDLASVGEVLRSGANVDELLPAVLQAAVASTGARGGRMLRGGVEIARVGKPAPGTPLGVNLDLGGGDRVRLLLYPPPLGFSGDATELLHWLSIQAGVAFESARTQGLAQQRALTDDLTGLASRAGLLAAIDVELRQVRRGRGPALVVADVDGLARVNEEHGHEVGDELLRVFADSFWRHLRPADLAARIGDDEFALLLPATRAHAAAELARRLAAELSEVRVETDSGSVAAGGGFGVAAHGRGGSGEELLAAAERALADAKAEGPGRVVVAGTRRRGLTA